MAFDSMQVGVLGMTTVVAAMTNLTHRSPKVMVATIVLLLLSAAVVGISYNKRDNDKKPAAEKTCMGDSIEQNHGAILAILVGLTLAINIPMWYEAQR